MALGSKWRIHLLLSLALAVTSACARPERPGPSALQASRQVPFHPSGEAEAQTATESSFGVPDQAPNAANAVPFRDPQSLPAGTLLTVSLKAPISSDSLKPGGVFLGEIDEPVTVDGTMLISPGAMVAGQVEAASATATRSGGFVRLTLNSVELSGRNLGLKTSSLFVRGKTADSGAAIRPSVVRLEAGRRLTFRLSEAVYVPGPLTSSSH